MLTMAVECVRRPKRGEDRGASGVSARFAGNDLLVVVGLLEGWA